MLKTVGMPAYTQDFGKDTLWTYDRRTLDRMTDKVDDMVQVRVGEDGRAISVMYVPERAR